MTTYVSGRFVDLRTLDEHTYVLAEFRQFYEREVAIGRDPGCDIVIDDPGVLPQHAWLSAGSNHRMVRMGDQPRRRHEGHPFTIGPFSIEIWESSELPPDRGPAALPIRFGGTRGIGQVAVERPRSAAPHDRARPFIMKVRDRTAHVRELDDAALAWCSGRIREHHARLSRAMPAYAPLEPGHLELTGSLAHALWRWRSEWRTVERYPFVAGTWAYVHRLAVWHAAHRGHSDEMIEKALELPGSAPWHDEAEPADVVKAVAGVFARADRDDEHAVMQPLVELAERGVIAFALPDRATLLYLASCPRDTRRFHGADPSERPLLRALFEDDRDAASCTVFADLLEARGELGRAQRLRQLAADTAAGIERPPCIQWVEELFHDACDAMMLRRRGYLEVPPIEPERGEVPPARLEWDGGQATLGAHTGIAVGTTIEVRDLDTDPAFAAKAIVTYGRGAFWVRLADYGWGTLSGLYLGKDGGRPMFDGDTFELDRSRLRFVLGDPKGT